MVEAMTPTSVNVRTLHIQLLGGFSLASGDQPVDGVNTARLQSLFAYLVLHRETTHLRQHVAFLFWPDSSEPQARNNLRQLLHALRLALPQAEAFLAADHQTLRWRPDGPFIADVVEFERALDQAASMELQGDGPGLRAALERATQLYAADLLP